MQARRTQTDRRADCTRAHVQTEDRCRWGRDVGEVECGATRSGRVRRRNPYNPGTTSPWRRCAA
eukprot:2349308-Prymnesium_polylepis.1